MNRCAEERFGNGEKGDPASGSRHIDDATGELPNDPLGLPDHNGTIAVDDLGLKERC